MKDISNAAGRYISKLGGYIRHRLDAISSESGITPAQGRTLQYIAGQNRNVYQKDIEEEYGLRAATASQMLQSMEDAGLICREVDEHDRRRKKIVITDEKREACENMIAKIGKMEDEMIEDIDEEKLIVFFEVVEKMLNNISCDHR